METALIQLKTMSFFLKCVSIVVYILSAIPSSCCGQATSDKDDAAIHELIESSYKAARRIKIDGRNRDWKKIVSVKDLNNKKIDDLSRDITRVAIAPLKKYLLVMIETNKRPSRENLAFWMDIDFVHNSHTDVRIGLSTTGKHRVKIFEDKESSVIEEFVTTKISAMVNEVVEVRIPYEVLNEHLPKPISIFVGPEYKSMDRPRPFRCILPPVGFKI